MADLCFVFASNAEKDAEGVIGKYFSDFYSTDVCPAVFIDWPCLANIYKLCSRDSRLQSPVGNFTQLIKISSRVGVLPAGHLERVSRHQTLLTLLL